jgi:predicted nucleic acid-binding protein
MNAEVFVDTNVLIYAHDRTAGEKHEVAAGIVAGLWNTRAGALSTQVLQEFYVNVTRKIPNPLSRSKAREIVSRYALWPLVQITAPMVLRASEVEEQYRLSFWDALIVTAAARSGARRLLTEDLNHGQDLLGLRVSNPFLASSDAP